MNLTIFTTNSPLAVDETLITAKAIPKSMGDTDTYQIGFASPYKSGDSLVATTPYGVVLKLVERKRNVSSTQILHEFNKRAEVMKLETGIIPYGSQIAGIKRQIRDELVSQQAPSESVFYVWYAGNAMCISTTTTSKISAVIYLLEQAGVALAGLSPVRASPEQVHAVCMTGEYLDFRPTNDVHMAHRGGETVHLKEFDPDSAVVQKFIADGLYIDQYGWADNVAEFTMKYGTVCGLKLNKRAKIELAQELRDAPEYEEAITFSLLTSYVTFDFIGAFNDTNQSNN